MYKVVNASDFYNEIKNGFKTLKEARQFIKELKEFDKRNGNPFKDNYIIEKE